MPKMLLSAIAISKLKPHPGKRLEIPDAGASGLYLILQPSGAKSWAFRHRHNGKPGKVTLGTFVPEGVTAAPVIGGRLTLAQARKLAGEALAMMERGESPATPPQRRDRNLVESVVAEFLLRYVDAMGLRTAAAIKRTFDVDVLPHWKGRRIEEIKRRDIRDLLDWHRDRGVTVQANRTLAAVKKFFSWAVDEEFIAASPADRVKRPVKEQTRSRILSDDEIVGLWQACESLGPPFGPLLRFMLLTGQRLSEAAGMQRSEIDGNAWLIPASRAKNNREHLVHLSDLAREALAAMPSINNGPLVFTTNGKTPVSGFSRAKKRVDELLPIPPWTFHDLRRTAASGMARLGHPVHVVEAVLNHKSGTISGVAAVYNRHSYAQEKAAALDEWARFIGSLLAPTENVVLLGAWR